MSFLDEFPRRIVNFPWLPISKALFIDLARQINTSLTHLLRLFAAENEGDAILDLQIIKFFQGSMPPDPSSLAPCRGP